MVLLLRRMRLLARSASSPWTLTSRTGFHVHAGEALEAWHASAQGVANQNKGIQFILSEANMMVKTSLGAWSRENKSKKKLQQRDSAFSCPLCRMF